MSFFQVQNLSYAYGDKPILLDLNFHLEKGQILGIIGPNGGGKSTLLKILAKKLPLQKGNIFFSQQDNQIGYVPQKADFNLTMPLKVQEILALYPRAQTSSVDSLLKQVGLEDKKNYLISHLSAGERQRFLIARALLNNPRLLLLDEPYNALDTQGQDQLLGLLKGLRSQLAMVIVDHNIEQLLKNCDKILCLNKTFHWHQGKEQLTAKVLQSIYHCEFEHLLMHETQGADVAHHECQDHDHHQEKKR